MSMSEKPTILICDDEEGIRESLKLILGDFYTLKFAHNGPEALETIKSQVPRLMLLDIKMPKVHGMEILKKIKSAFPALPVIMVSGYQSVEMAQEAIRNGATDYIPKPFDSKNILRTVAEILSKTG